MEYRIAESASGSAVLHITEVHALSSFRLWAKFSTGETRVLDLHRCWTPRPFVLFAIQPSSGRSVWITVFRSGRMVQSI